MRRRGLSPQGINLLCQELGITRSENEIPLHKLFHHVRAHLDESSPRALAVLRPLKLVRSCCCVLARVRLPCCGRSNWCVPAAACSLLSAAVRRAAAAQTSVLLPLRLPNIAGATPCSLALYSLFCGHAHSVLRLLKQEFTCCLCAPYSSGSLAFCLWLPVLSPEASLHCSSCVYR